LSYRSDIDMGAPPKGVSRRRDECGGRGSPVQRQLQRVQLVFRRQTSPQRGAARAYVAICIVTLLDREMLGRLFAWHQCGATLRVAFLDDAERRISSRRGASCHNRPRPCPDQAQRKTARGAVLHARFALTCRRYVELTTPKLV